MNSKDKEFIRKALVKKAYGQPNLPIQYYGNTPGYVINGYFYPLTQPEHLRERSAGIADFIRNNPIKSTLGGAVLLAGIPHAYRYWKDPVGYIHSQLPDQFKQQGGAQSTPDQTPTTGGSANTQQPTQQNPGSGGQQQPNTTSTSQITSGSESSQPSAEPSSPPPPSDSGGGGQAPQGATASTQDSGNTLESPSEILGENTQFHANIFSDDGLIGRIIKRLRQGSNQQQEGGTNPPAPPPTPPGGGTNTPASPASQPTTRGQALHGVTRPTLQPRRPQPATSRRSGSERSSNAPLGGRILDRNRKLRRGGLSTGYKQRGSLTRHTSGVPQGNIPQQQPPSSLVNLTGTSEQQDNASQAQPSVREALVSRAKDALERAANRIRGPQRSNQEGNAPVTNTTSDFNQEVPTPNKSTLPSERTPIDKVVGQPNRRTASRRSSAMRTMRPLIADAIENVDLSRKIDRLRGRTTGNGPKPPATPPPNSGGGGGGLSTPSSALRTSQISPARPKQPQQAVGGQVPAIPGSIANTGNNIPATGPRNMYTYTDEPFSKEEEFLNRKKTLGNGFYESDLIPSARRVRKAKKIIEDISGQPDIPAGFLSGEIAEPEGYLPPAIEGYLPSSVAKNPVGSLSGRVANQESSKGPRLSRLPARPEQPQRSAGGQVPAIPGSTATTGNLAGLFSGEIAKPDSSKDPRLSRLRARSKKAKQATVLDENKVLPAIINKVTRGDVNSDLLRPYKGKGKRKVPRVNKKRAARISKIIEKTRKEVEKKSSLKNESSLFDTLQKMISNIEKEGN